MPYRASAPRKVAGLGKDAVDAVEVLDTDFDADDFVSLSTSTVQHESGYAEPVYAVMPEKHLYHKLIFSFGIPTLGNADNTAELVLLARTSDGSVIRIGSTEMDDNDSFPQITVPNHDAKYYVQVGAIGGTTPAVTVDVFVQGLYDES